MELGRTELDWIVLGPACSREFIAFKYAAWSITGLGIWLGVRSGEVVDVYILAWRWFPHPRVYPSKGRG
jgi:hypothetical protein